jgi:hypothetical protein
VPTLTLSANYYLSIPFDVNVPILRVTGSVQYRVESDHPINVYIVDPQGLAEFSQGVAFHFYDRAEGVLQHSNKLRLPIRGQAYLLISNPNPNPTAVHYDIS